MLFPEAVIFSVHPGHMSAEPSWVAVEQDGDPYAVMVPTSVANSDV
jgi:hypothetical protein